MISIILSFCKRIPTIIIVTITINIIIIINVVIVINIIRYHYPHTHFGIVHLLSIKIHVTYFAPT